MSPLDRWLADRVIGRIPGAGPAHPPTSAADARDGRPLPASPPAGPDRAPLRAGGLLGSEVHDADGRRVGVLTDLRCVQDGPLAGAMAAPRVHALLVSRRHTGSLLGYDRRAQQRPWLIRLVIRALHRHPVEVPWSAVADHHHGIRLSAAATDFDRP